MSEKRLLAAGSLLSAVVLFIRIGVAFFLTPFIIKILGEHFYGIWVLIGAFVGYYGAFDFGISSAVVRYASREIGAGRHQKVNYYVNSAFFLLLLLGALVIIISFATAFCVPFIISGAENQKFFQFAFIIMGIAVGSAFPLRVFDGLLGAQLRFDLKRYIELFELLFRTIAVIIAMNLGHGIYGLAVVSSLSTMLELGLKSWACYWVDPSLKISLKYLKIEKIKEMMDFSIATFINTINSIVSNQLATYLVALVSNVKTVAYYGVAITLINYYSEFFRSTQGVLFPLFSQRDGSGDISSMKRWLFIGSRISTVLSASGGILVILYGWQFLGRWLGSSFHISYYYTAILITPLILSFGMFPTVFVLNSTGKHRMATALDIVRSLSIVILSLFLGYKYDAIGVAIGTAVPFFIFDGIAKPYFACTIIQCQSMRYYGTVFFTIFKVGMLIFPVWFIWGKDVDEKYFSIFFISCVHLCTIITFGSFIFINKEERKTVKLFLQNRYLSRS